MQIILQYILMKFAAWDLGHIIISTLKWFVINVCIFCIYKWNRLERNPCPWKQWIKDLSRTNFSWQYSMKNTLKEQFVCLHNCKLWFRSKNSKYCYSIEEKYYPSIRPRLQYSPTANWKTFIENLEMHFFQLSI